MIVKQKCLCCFSVSLNYEGIWSSSNKQGFRQIEMEHFQNCLLFKIIHRLQYLRATLTSSWTRFSSHNSDSTFKTFFKANVLKLNGCWIDVFFHTKGNSKTWYIQHNSSTSLTMKFPCQLWTQISLPFPIILSETVTDPICSLNAAISKTLNNQYSLFQRYPPLVTENYPNFKVNNKLSS